MSGKKLQGDTQNEKIKENMQKNKGEGEGRNCEQSKYIRKSLSS